MQRTIKQGYNPARIVVYLMLTIKALLKVGLSGVFYWV
jgi:hypothetical protein